MEYGSIFEIWVCVVSQAFLNRGNLRKWCHLCSVCAHDLLLVKITGNRTYVRKLAFWVQCKKIYNILWKHSNLNKIDPCHLSIYLPTFVLTVNRHSVKNGLTFLTSHLKMWHHETFLPHICSLGLQLHLHQIKLFNFVKRIKLILFNANHK